MTDVTVTINYSCKTCLIRVWDEFCLRLHRYSCLPVTVILNKEVNFTNIIPKTKTPKKAHSTLVLALSSNHIANVDSLKLGFVFCFCFFPCTCFKHVSRLKDQSGRQQIQDSLCTLNFLVATGSQTFAMFHMIHPLSSNLWSTVYQQIKAG